MFPEFPVGFAKFIATGSLTSTTFTGNPFFAFDNGFGRNLAWPLGDGDFDVAELL